MADTVRASSYDALICGPVAGSDRDDVVAHRGRVADAVMPRLDDLTVLNIIGHHRRIDRLAPASIHSAVRSAPFPGKTVCRSPAARDVLGMQSSIARVATAIEDATPVKDESAAITPLGRRTVMVHLFLSLVSTERVVLGGRRALTAA